MRSAAHPQVACTYQMDAAMRRRTRQSASRRHVSSVATKTVLPGLKLCKDAMYGLSVAKGRGSLWHWSSANDERVFKSVSGLLRSVAERVLLRTPSSCPRGGASDSFDWSGDGEAAVSVFIRSFGIGDQLHGPFRIAVACDNLQQSYALATRQSSSSGILSTYPSCPRCIPEAS
jgi:hypothetical protein